MKRKRILLVKLDRIGDYILFRNLLQTIRTNSKYCQAHITILANPIWRGIAETYDKDCVDEWIWLENRDRCFRQSHENLLPGFVWKRRVRHEQEKVRRILRGGRFDEVVSLTVFRDPQLDWLVEGLAPVVIGAKAPQPMITDSCYTELIPIDRGPFVYDMNCDLVGKLTASSCAPLALANSVPVESREGILIFIGASHPTRQMPSPKYRELVRRLLERTDEAVVIAGGKREAAFVQEVACGFPPSRVSTIAGTQSLPELISSVQSCKCVIANDTGPMHIAAVSGIPTVCITNGFSGEGSFWPYPDGRVKIIQPRCRPKSLSPFLPMRLIQQRCVINSVSIGDVLDAVKDVDSGFCWEMDADLV